jgi:hypothetical protein
MDFRNKYPRPDQVVLDTGKKGPRDFRQPWFMSELTAQIPDEIFKQNLNSRLEMSKYFENNVCHRRKQMFETNELWHGVLARGTCMF